VAVRFEIKKGGARARSELATNIVEEVARNNKRRASGGLKLERL
jgi:hypothetical protein